MKLIFNEKNSYFKSFVINKLHRFISKKYHIIFLKKDS